MLWILAAMLVVAACVAVPLYLDWRHARLSALPREVPPLVFSMPGSEWRAELRGLRPAPAAPPGSAEALEGPSANDTVHFRRPSDEALQLLPGRLEVLSGISAPREIRFVRIPGERPQLILGREPARSPQHVTLPSSTVSRQHARLDFAGGRWGLTNLSKTNPVVVNDETLSSGQGERALVDGDRIELGDVVLRFRAH
jgi:hypothetical protein